MPISGILERIASNLDQLADSEARVARWILAHPEEVVTLSVRELARQARSSQAAVTRLCRSLDVDGYPALKVLLASDLGRLARQTSSDFVELQPGTPFSMILQGFSRAAQESVRTTLDGIGEDTLARVRQYLQRARRIAIFGVGASYVVADDLSQKLTRLAYPCYCFADFHRAAVAAALLTAEDVGIAISFSGETQEVIEFSDLVRRRDAAVIAITQYRKHSPLLERAQVALYVTAIEPARRIGATTSILTLIAINDVLTLYLANQDPDAAYQNLLETEHAVKHHRVSRQKDGGRR